jgi:extracellular matrix regulatory protein A
MKLINIGFGNMIAAERIVAVVSPDSAPVKRMIQEARDAKQIVDATQGRRTRAVIVANSGHIVLSAIQPETVAGRAGGREPAPQTDEREI